MRTRDYYFKREATLLDSDVTVIDIDIPDPISFIKIEIEATNGATSCIDHELHDDVSAIEVVDGSRVLESLSMIRWLRLNTYELGRVPPQVLTEEGGVKQEESVYILFGRYPDDPDYYFLRRNFKNPQLRITHALTISATAGFATGTGRLTVMARIIEEGAKAYQGMMMSKVIESFTSGASGDKIVDLYTDYNYRHLLVQALLTANSPEAVLTRMKLSLDADREVPFDLFTEDIMDYVRSRYGEFAQNKTVLAVDGNTSLFDLYALSRAYPVLAPADTVVSTTALGGERVTMAVYRGHDAAADVTGLEAVTVAKTLGYRAEGLAPSAMLTLPIAGGNDPGDWFVATKYEKAQLILTQAAAGACAVVGQQVLR